MASRRRSSSVRTTRLPNPNCHPHPPLPACDSPLSFWSAQVSTRPSRCALSLHKPLNRPFPALGPARHSPLSTHGLAGVQVPCVCGCFKQVATEPRPLPTVSLDSHTPPTLCQACRATASRTPLDSQISNTHTHTTLPIPLTLALALLVCRPNMLVMPPQEKSRNSIT